jgi:chromosomal replication initiation ATPase DnaA
MQLYSRLQLFQPEGTDRGGCKGVQDTSISLEEEAGRSHASGGENLGDIAETVSVKKILLALSDVTGCPPLELINHRRSREVMPYRHLLYALAKELTWQSFPQLGKTLNRDHSTVLHGAKRGQKLIETDPKISKVYKQVKRKLVA